jgi:hypothetical protein
VFCLSVTTLIKHTIISKKPRVVSAPAVQVETRALVIPSDSVHSGMRKYPNAGDFSAIQAAIDAAREGQLMHRGPIIPIARNNNKINSQQAFNEYLDEIKVTAGEYATFNASRQVKSIFQIYYIHYVEVDFEKVTWFDHNGYPCPVQVIQCHEMHGDKSPFEWHTGTKLRALSQEEKENVISDQVRNRIQSRIGILQSAEPRSSDC